MSWLSLHEESEKYAASAHAALKRGNPVRAKELFVAAAKAEASALTTIADDKPRTLGITAVSAVALWYKAGELKKAEQLAHHASSAPAMPDFALRQLRELLQVIWNEQVQKAAGISFMPGQVLVSVKGGKIVTGGAPLELILNKVQTIQNIFYRTFEFLKDMPLRKKGPPSRELQEQCRPWLFQSVPGSYQFAVAIQKPVQMEMFPTDDPEPEVLTETFLTILRAAGEDPAQGLKDVVPKEEYRQTFLKMTRNLAPTGKTFEQMEIRGSGDHKPIVLVPNSRKLISETLRPQKAEGKQDAETEQLLRGTLRALDLDNDWLDVVTDGKHIRVSGLNEAVDDLIGPMVNHEVTVRVKPGRGKKLLFRDIEQEE